MILERPHSTGNPYAKILVIDHHSTYGPAMFGDQSRQGVTGQVVWDFFAIADASRCAGGSSDDVAVNAAFRTLFPAVAGDMSDEDMYGDVWTVYGKVPLLVDMVHHCAAILANEPSGDDDTFDYWPSGVRAALSFADDVDALTNYTGQMRRVIVDALAPMIDAMGWDEHAELLS